MAAVCCDICSKILPLPGFGSVAAHGLKHFETCHLCKHQFILLNLSVVILILDLLILVNIDIIV